MRALPAAVVGFCVLVAISAGVARATTGGGATIATAPIATPGVQEVGSTSTFTDPCHNGYEFWLLPLKQGDLVKITWGVPAAVDTLALWTPETVDTDHPACLYESGFSNWTSDRLVLADSNGAAGTTRLSQITVSEDGTYPLLLLNTTGANAGSYSFKADVLHAASVSFAHQSKIPGAGTFTASVLAPDGSPINDSTLKLTLNAYWSTRAGAPPRAHTLATASPTNGLATFSYSLPWQLWGKKIRLGISGVGASYQPVTSENEKVKVLVPAPLGPVLASATELNAVSKALRQPIYWAGRQKGFHYEFTRLTNGNAYVRYLPHGTHPGDRPGKCLIVATYPLDHAFKKLKKFGGRGKAVAGPHGSIYLVDPNSRKSVFVAFPQVNFEIEIYDPSPKVARSIAADGLVRPVRS